MTESFPIPAQHLRQEYELHHTQFERQPAMVQRFLENQARLLAEALVSGATRLRFFLPDHVANPMAGVEPEAANTIPPEKRRQVIGNLFDQLRQREVRESLLQHLVGL